MIGYRAMHNKSACLAGMLVLISHAAHALEANAVADRLKALAVNQGLHLSWAGIDGDPSKMILEDVTVRLPHRPEPISIGDITLSNVTSTDGGFLVDTASTDPFSMNEKGFSVDVGPMVFRQLSLPDPESDDPLSSFMIYESSRLSSISATMNGTPVLKAENAHGSASRSANGTIAFTAGIERFSFDASLVGDANVKAYLQALGYRQFTGEMKAAGSWQPTGGRWQLTQYDIAFEDLGTFGLTLDLEGLTPDVIQENAKIFTPASTEGRSASSVLKNITFHGGSLRFSDNSLTGRVLELVASQQGASRSDVIATTQAALPFLLMQAGLADLSGHIAPALGQYLNNPQNIEIVAAPATPVSFADILRILSSANPDGRGKTTAALWQLLGLKAAANR